MKPRCPVPNCGKECPPGLVLCVEHWSEVPQQLKAAVQRAPLLIKQARKPMAVHAALSNQRRAREAAIQFIIDKHNSKEKVSA
jgi:hypothetical protein